MKRILDASALLALLHDEPGAEQVRQVLEGSLVSTVNWSEVVQKSLRQNVNVKGMQQEFSDAGVIFELFTLTQAELAAQLWEQTRLHGLSLADRACLALALEKKLPVLTADQVWRKLDIDIKVEVIR